MGLTQYDMKTSIILVIFMVMHAIALGMICSQETETLYREKRHLYTIGREVLNSIAAMRKLKKDAIPVLPEKYKVNLYTKEGDFSAAMKDFNSFQPQQVFNCYGARRGSQKWAFVGDRTLCLQEVGESGLPTFYIYRGLGTSREKLDTFIYED